MITVCEAQGRHPGGRKLRVQAAHDLHDVRLELALAKLEVRPHPSRDTRTKQVLIF